MQESVAKLLGGSPPRASTSKGCGKAKDRMTRRKAEKNFTPSRQKFYYPPADKNPTTHPPVDKNATTHSVGSVNLRSVPAGAASLKSAPGVSAKPTNKRCKISKVCTVKSYSDKNKRDSLVYEIYDRRQEAKRGNIL